MADGGARGEIAPMRASVRNPCRRRCVGRRRGRQEGSRATRAKAKQGDETRGAQQPKLMHREDVGGWRWEAGGGRWLVGR